MPLRVRPCAECAVKTIVAKGKTFTERLAAFETEAKVSWLASQTARKVSSPQPFPKPYTLDRKVLRLHCKVFRLPSTAVLCREEWPRERVAAAEG